MFVDKLKARVLEAAKGGDTVARDVLRLALGEIQTAEARKNAALPEEDAVALVRKLVKSNEETLASMPAEDARVPALKRELEVLASILPAQLTAAQVAELLAPVQDAVRAAPSDGQATGVAVKHLKASGVTAPGQVVTEAVKTLRAG